MRCAWGVSNLQIQNLSEAVKEHKDVVQQVADLLFANFATPDGWPTIESALLEVQESLAPDRISRVALDDQGNVIGWIGGMQDYDGHVWELHPLVVCANSRGQGIGRALVLDLEDIARAMGGKTVMLGTDDLDCATSLGGVDLYTNLWTHIKDIKNLRRHPYEFYQKLGYSIVGVVPDANGPGKPDILMAKSLDKN